jgi:hypothetical protein
MSVNVLVWLIAVAGVVLLWRLRGRRGILMLLGLLAAVVLFVVAWNVVVSHRVIR